MARIPIHLAPLRTVLLAAADSGLNRLKSY